MSFYYFNVGLNRLHKNCIPKCPPKECSEPFHVKYLKEMPRQKCPSVWVGLSTTQHKMAWNRLWAGTLEYTFCVGLFSPLACCLTCTDMSLCRWRMSTFGRAPWRPWLGSLYATTLSTGMPSIPTDIQGSLVMACLRTRDGLSLIHI